MKGTAEKFDTIFGIQYFRPARVLEHDQDEGRVRVMLACPEEGNRGISVWARPAIPYRHEYRWGDSVLVAGEFPDQLYVIGILNNEKTDRETAKSIELKNGIRAVVTGDPEEEKLKVFSAEGGLIFEHDAGTGKSRVDVPAGDLEVGTREGGIAFTSAKGIRLSSRESIELQSTRLGINARDGDIQIETAMYQGRQFSGRLTDVKLMVERLESLACTVIEKAKNIYRTVEELAQLRTGRMRTLVESTFHLKSKKALLKAEEDFNVRADKINLG